MLSVATMLTACGKTDREKAEEYLQRSKDMVAIGNTAEALRLTDSIDVLFPMEVAVRRCADTIEWRIELNQIETLLPEIEDSLATVQDTLPKLTKNFRFKKDEKYQDVGTFEHKILQTENNVNRCYIKPATDEHGILMLTSNFIGKKSQHNHLTVIIDDVLIETPIADESSIIRFNDDEDFREIIVWKGEDIIPIFAFIKANRDKKIKVTLSGDSKYVFYITGNEKDAFCQTYDLASALTMMQKLTDRQLKSAQKAEYLKNKLGL